MQLLRIKIHKKGAVPIKRRRREKFDIMKPYKLQRWVEITTNVGCSNMCLYCPQKKLIKTYFAEKRPANMSFRMFKNI
jgi:biotin synthase-like enzyme